MKLILLILLISTQAFASYPTLDFENRGDGWAFGVGFGTEAAYRSISALDIKSPRLFVAGPLNVALVFSFESKELLAADRGTTPLHLLFDFSYRPYKEIVKAYFRLGAGSVIVSDQALFPDNEFFNVQAIWGVEIITMRTDGGSYGTFFIQTALNAPAIRTPPLNHPDIYDGISIIVGLRTYL